MKRCTICKRKKDESEFAWKKRDIRRQSRCRVCQKKMSDDWYAKNKAKHLINVKANNAKYSKLARKVIHEAKNRPCMDCGVRYGYWIMQFDHRDGRDKKFSISCMGVSFYSIQTIIDEIAKCDVVCANCHFERTYSRMIKKKGDYPFDASSER